MIPRPQALFAPDQRADERTFQKEREHAFHRQRLSDRAACIPGKARPVRAKLKLYEDAGDHPHGKMETENFGPKPHGFLILFIARPQGTLLPIHQEPRQSHGELRKKVVLGHREAELHPAPKRRIGDMRVHGRLLRSWMVFEGWRTTAAAAFSHDAALVPTS